MTYKEKMDKEHPIVDPDYIMFSCPGHFFDGAPRANEKCGNTNKSTCYKCWTQNMPEPAPETAPSIEFTGIKQLDVKKIAARVKEVYKIFRDEELNHQEALEFTKIIIAEEVRHEMS